MEEQKQVKVNGLELPFRTFQKCWENLRTCRLEKIKLQKTLYSTVWKQSITSHDKKEKSRIKLEADRAWPAVINEESWQNRSLLTQVLWEDKS